jgi:5-methylcytosine-specific restriction protein A
MQFYWSCGLCVSIRRQGREADTLPMLPLHKCAAMSCSNLTSSKYCEQHRIQKRQVYDKQRGNAQERGYTARWQKVSKLFLQEHPLCECEDCKRIGRLTTATVVHHIVPHKGNYNLFWNQDNWQAMSKKCHDKHTYKEIRQGTKKGKLSVEVILVAGSPLAGKTTYVKQHKGKDDLVFDYDSLLAALTGEELYYRPAWSTDIILDIRETVMKYIEKRTALRKAWIIATAPTVQQRQYFKDRLNAKVIVINPGKQVCLQRLQQDNRMSDYHEAIQRFYANYEQSEQDIEI